MVRFGILGTARIARAFFRRPLDHARIDVIASRSGARAEEFAKEFGVPRAVEGYEALLHDPLIDAVYIPLPHHLHSLYAIKAADAKKHVLVEKPAALTAGDVLRMGEACRRNHVLLMEGFMYRFMSIHRRARDLVRDGSLGTVRWIDFSWSYSQVRRAVGGFRADPDLGGGSLYDLGVYGVDFVRFIGDCHEPQVLGATVRRGQEGGIDRFAHALLSENGMLASVSAGFDTDANYYMVCGDKGSLYAPVSLSGRSVETVLWIHRTDGDTRNAERFSPEHPYCSEMEEFALCIEQNRQPEPGAGNSLANLRLIEEIRRTAHTVPG